MSYPMTPVNKLLYQSHDVYDIDYFISHFEEIAEGYWTLSIEDNPHDAWEWLSEPEADELLHIIKPFGILLQVNDGDGEWLQYGSHPKERVLKFLKWVKHCLEEMTL